MSGARAVPWAEGIETVYGARQGPAPVFLTPVVDGWTLAVLGVGGLSADNGGGDVVDLPSLSRRFGEVQMFATHRVVEYQEWQRWVDGSPVRPSGVLLANVPGRGTRCRPWRRPLMSACSRGLRRRARRLRPLTSNADTGEAMAPMTI